MALKAGRVGIRPELVDAEGYLVGGGGESGVQDVKVDGVSVVSEGVASITLPDVPVQDVKVDGVSVVTDGIANIVIPSGGGDVQLEEVNSYSTADLAIATVTANTSSSLTEWFFADTEVTINDTAQHLLVRDANSATHYIKLKQGNKLLLEREIGDQNDYRNHFVAHLGNGEELVFTLNSATGAIQNVNLVICYQKTSNSASARGINLGAGSITSNFTIKFYKIKEV